MIRYVCALITVMLAANVIGCGGSSSHGGGGGGGGGGTTTTLTLSITSGANQSAPDGAALPQPLVFSVVDQNGSPVSGATITIAAASPDGVSGTLPTVSTNSTGSASATFGTLDHGSGIYGCSAQATGSGASSNAIAFSETGVATTLTTTKVSGDNQTVSSGSTVTLVVKVTDQIGVVAFNASVVFVVNGTAQPAVFTDHTGQATFRFTAAAAGAYTTAANAGLSGVISNSVTFADTAQ